MAEPTSHSRFSNTSAVQGRVRSTVICQTLSHHIISVHCSVSFSVASLPPRLHVHFNFVCHHHHSRYQVREEKKATIAYLGKLTLYLNIKLQERKILISFIYIGLGYYSFKYCILLFSQVGLTVAILTFRLSRAGSLKKEGTQQANWI